MVGSIPSQRYKVLNEIDLYLLTWKHVHYRVSRGRKSNLQKLYINVSQFALQGGLLVYAPEKKSGSIFTSLLTITLKNGDRRAESEKGIYTLYAYTSRLFSILNDFK